MSERWEVVVVGIGAMGSAALFHLARRGHRVLGLERFWVPNDRGSSHGRSRILRLPYHEDSRYVSLILRAVELWKELERISGERLFRATGSLDGGTPGSALFEGSLEACRTHGLDHEVVSSSELSRRWPAFRLPSDLRAVFQPDGGVLDPERCVETHARFAESLGAVLRTGVRVEEVEASEGGVVLRWSDGQERRGEVHAERVVLTTGAWSGNFLDLATDALVPERQVFGWLRPFTKGLFTPDRFPVFHLEVEEGHYYGYPDLSEEGIKVGRSGHLGERVDPDRMPRTSTARDRAVIRDFVERYIPEGAGETAELMPCLFTNTPDRHFVIDRVPDRPRVVVAAGFSGHGFKFSSVVGEILADLAVDGRTRHDIDLFRYDRLAGS